MTSLTEHWRAVGLPGSAQFDNDMIFHGTHRYPDALGRVIRLCLSLSVVPVFVPPRETGFQAMIESYNGWWQARVWVRFHHQNLQDVQQRSSRHVQAVRATGDPFVLVIRFELEGDLTSVGEQNAGPAYYRLPYRRRRQVADLDLHSHGTLARLQQGQDRRAGGVLQEPDQPRRGKHGRHAPFGKINR